jgi:hypothetical protein
MAVENHQLEIYQRIWSLILNDPDFRTVSGVEVGANNQIRIDNGKVSPRKKTAGQDGDLPELEILVGELRDDGDAGDEDQDRPTFAVVQGEDITGPRQIEYEYEFKLTYPAEKFESFFPLLEVIRRNVCGYRLRRSGLAYTGNVSLVANYDPATVFRSSIRPQHSGTITVRVQKG